MANLQKESRLTFIKFTEQGKDPKALYICECGNIKQLYFHNVRRGLTKSCGCLRKEITSIRFSKHRLSSHPLYAVRRAMIDRCYKTSCEYYKDYGGRGITVCDEWLNSFESYFDWCIKNGWKEGMEVDKDIKGGLIYSPENCSVVTKRGNANKKRNNRILEFNGEQKTMSQWGDIFQISRKLIGERINRHGWSIEKALTTPKKYERAKK